MREDVTLLDINGESSTFASYVYAWFAPTSDYIDGGSEAKSQQEADEDRWGLYYGVKAMAKDKDPEATIFWTLLEETHGEDGMHFVFHCLSIWPLLWAVTSCGSSSDTLTTKSVGISLQPTDRPSIRHNIWIDVGSAVDALKAILVRALKPHVKEAVEAVYAFREIPAVADPQVAMEEEDEDPASSTTVDGRDELERAGNVSRRTDLAAMMKRKMRKERKRFLLKTVSLHTSIYLFGCDYYYSKCKRNRFTVAQQCALCVSRLCGSAHSAVIISQ